MKQINDLHTDCRFRIFFLLNLLVVLFVGTGVSINAQVGEISGPTVVCSSSAQYTLSIPSGCTVIWYTTGIVQLSSPQASNPATFSITGNGSGSITADVYNNMDELIGSKQKSIWSGPPTDPWAVTSETAWYGYVGNWYGFAVWPSDLDGTQEAVPNLYGGDDVYYYGNDYFRLYFGYAGTYQIAATYSNTCGESNATYLIDGFEVFQ